MAQGIFVTGTDTGVGKTHVTALLLAELRRRGLRAAGFKPIACGPGGREDARQYWELMNREVPLDVVNPVYLRHPLAPSVAARLQKRHIDLRRVHSAFGLLSSAFDILLVEGAGGLMVPIKRNYFIADLARELGLPVVIVARLGLGTINHCVLTVRQALAAGLKVAGIILNDTTGRRGLAERTNASAVRELAGAPLLGVAKHGARSDVRGLVAHLFDERRE
jgi:dethiobiotin synthetase